MPKYKLTYNDSVHVFDSDAFLLDGEKLQGQEYTILSRLVSAKGAYIRKDEIANFLWNDDIDADQHNIKPRISQLRSKFGKDGKIIECEKFKFGDQAGYHLNCDIVEINELTTDIFTPFMNASISENDRETEYEIRKHTYGDFEARFIANKTHKFNIAITSDGGIGKTTFARILYDKLRTQYSSIGWIDYSKSLDESILASTNKWQNERRDIRLDKIDEFFSNAERKLLIIDNVIDNPKEKQFPLQENEGYFNFAKLTSYNNLDIIITTRFENFPGYIVYPLQELDDAACFEMFIYYYDSWENIEEYDTDDFELIKAIVSIAHNNSLLIELFARAAKYHYFDSLQDMYEYIESDRYKEASVVEKVRALYKIDTLSQEQQKILWEFAILPNMSLNGRDIEDFMKIKVNNEEFRYLVDRGWISFKGKDGCTMHDVIKESILTRCSIPMDENSEKPYDYNTYSFSYKHNLNGFAPEFCFSDLYSKRETVDKVFNKEGLSISDYKKRVDLLVAMTNYLKLSNNQSAYLYALIGFNTYHRLGEKEKAEAPFRYSLECIIEKDAQNTSISAPSWSMREKHPYNYNSDTLYITVSYELAYALSSMGIARHEESYDLMKTTLINHLNRNQNSTFSYEYSKMKNDPPHIIYALYMKMEERLSDVINKTYPEKILLNEFDNICEELLDKRYKLGSIPEYNMVARIMDHAAYIITICKPEEYDTAEKYLKAALRIRTIIHKLHSLNRISNTEYETFIMPFKDYVDSVNRIIESYNSNFEDLFINPDDFKFFTVFSSEKYNSDKYYELLCKDFQQTEEQINTSCSQLESECIIGSVRSYDIINYYLMHADFKKYLKSIAASKNNHAEKELIRHYFGFYSDSNFIKSLQDQGTTEDNLGYLYVQMGNYTDAELHLHQAKDIRIRLEDYEQKKHLSELSWTYNNIGELYLRMYEVDKEEHYLSDSIANYEKAVEHRTELNKLFNNRYLDNLAWSYTGLWRCYLNRKDSTKAEEYREKALAIYDDLNEHNKYDNDIKILNSEDPLSEPLNWVGNQSHFKSEKASKNKA